MSLRFSHIKIQVIHQDFPDSHILHERTTSKLQFFCSFWTSGKPSRENILQVGRSWFWGLMYGYVLGVQNKKYG